MRRVRNQLLVFLAALGGAASLVAPALGDAPMFTKLCDSPTKIGYAYTCTYSVQNSGVVTPDTVTVDSIFDVVFTATAAIAFPVLPSARIVSSGGAACLAGSGTGTSGDPYINATSCVLLPGAGLVSLPFSGYTVVAADFLVSLSTLNDEATLTWHDSSSTPMFETSSSSTLVQKMTSSTTAQVIVDSGTGDVHASVTVAGEPGRQPPTGYVDIDWFGGPLNLNCSGTPDATTAPLHVGPLDANGVFDASAFAHSSGSYRATYLGDPSYLGSVGPCVDSTGAFTGLPLSGGATVTTPTFGTVSSGVPTALWTDPLTLTTNCISGPVTATFTLGTYLQSFTVGVGQPVTFAPPVPNHGLASITIACGTASSFSFNVYIDPSGVVRDTFGFPVAGATVTLSRSLAGGGPFVVVPQGSAIMSPGNRVNPDQSRPGGGFGWDVTAGFYKVRAEKTGCTAPGGGGFTETGVLTIPPPVTDLVLVLDCPTPPADLLALIAGMSLDRGLANDLTGKARDAAARHCERQGRVQAAR